MKTLKVFVFLIVGTLAACHKFNTPPSKQIQFNNRAILPTSIQSISDIAAPANAQINMENSLIVGSNDSWLGRLIYEADEEPLQVWLFLQREMPKIGWQSISAIHAKVSILTFKRGERVATIQIESKIIGGSIVTINVSPAGQGSGLIPSPSAEIFSKPSPDYSSLENLTPPVNSPPLGRTIIE